MERQAQGRVKNLACIIIFFIVFFILPLFQDQAGLFGDRIGDPIYRESAGTEQITLFPVLGSHLREAQSLLSTGYRKYRVVSGRVDDAVAHGAYVEKASGRKELHLSRCSTSQAWHACGFLEGYLTHKQMRVVLENLAATLTKIYSQDIMDKVKRHLSAYELSLEETLDRLKSPDDPTPPDEKLYWGHIGDVFAHMEGIRDGYNQASTQGERITMTDIFLLNALADVHAIAISKMPADQRPSFSADEKNPALGLATLIKHSIGTGTILHIAGTSEEKDTGYGTAPQWLSSLWSTFDWEELRTLKYMSVNDGVHGPMRWEHVALPGSIVPQLSFHVVHGQEGVLLKSLALTFIRIAAASHNTSSPFQWARLVSSPPGRSSPVPSSCMRLVVSSLPTEASSGAEWFVVEQIPAALALVNKTSDLHRAGFLVATGEALLGPLQKQASDPDRFYDQQMRLLEPLSTVRINQHISENIHKPNPIDAVRLLYVSTNSELLRDVSDKLKEEDLILHKVADLLQLKRLKLGKD